jgi:hypothetical protein
MTTKAQKSLTRSVCIVCRRNIAVYRVLDSENGDGDVWAHSGMKLEKTGGHAAVPDPAKTYTVEVP